ncbi:MAG: cytochrome c biogenesis heme-transporting ATPase CcmA [Pseudomonadota bacterium]
MSELPFLQAGGLLAVRDARPLFRDLAVSLRAGEVLRVEGPNGAGKTTLLRVLCGLDQDFEGELRFPAADSAGRPWREDFLYLGHLPGLKPALTARQNLDWLTRLRGLPLRMDAGDALARVGLRGHEDLPAAALSAGQRRRVALARLYLEPAPVWVLDEPFTAIDRDGVAALEQLLAAHAAGGGAVLLTTHHALAGVPARSLTLGAAA